MWQGIVIFHQVFVLVFCTLFYFSVSATAHAALLYFDPAVTELSRGDTTTLGLRIDTDEGECINTVDAIIKYDPSIRAVDISRGSSILSLWLEDPVINEASSTITLAGGIPGGYCGRIAGDPNLTTLIAEIVFRSPGFNVGGGGTAQSANIWIDDASQVLLHDGFGTPSNLRTQGATISLLSTPASTTSDTWTTRVQEDTIPPSDFLITLSKDNVAFNGKYFISFSSLDKQSGIDHYEIMEEPFVDFYLFKWGRADAPWRAIQSPYILKDQSLNSTIRVKAIDKAGNETVSTLVPDEAIRSVSHNRLITYAVGVGTLILILILVGYVLWRRKRKLVDSYNHESSS